MTDRVELDVVAHDDSKHAAEGPPAAEGNKGSRFYGALVRYHTHRDTAAPSREQFSRAAVALGIDELYSGDVYRGTLIEFFATTIFMVVHCGIVAHAVEAYPPPAKDPGLYIGIGHFLLLGFFILCFAAPSGGHMNPLITWATATTGHTPIARALLYTAAQTAGAALGAVVFKAASPGRLALAACHTGALEAGGAFVAETFFSIALLCVAYGTAFDARQGQVFGPILAPFFISAQLGLLIWASGGLAPGYTGAGMNPALCWAPNVVAGGAADVSPQWVYWLGPFVASVIHAVVYLALPPHHKDLYDAMKKEA